MLNQADRHFRAWLRRRPRAVGLQPGRVIRRVERNATGQRAAATASADAPGSVPTAGSGTNAAPENVNGQPPVLLDCEGYPVVEPKEYSLDCYDAINDLENLHWTKWGQTAVATGTEELNPCTGACTMRGATRYPVSIQVNTTLEVSGKPDTYVVMTISYAGAMPRVINGETGDIITQRQHNSWSERLPIPGGWDGTVS